MRNAGRALVVFALVLAPGRSALAQAPTIEYDVKAAFLLNFIRFVEWPEPSRRGQPFGLCSFEPDPFGDRLESAAVGELWEGQRIAVHRVSAVHRGECHLLYVPARAMPAFLALQREAGAQSILTVGESRDFLDRGGIIQFVVESNRVRFSINTRNANAAGLKIGSRLLRLARDVVGTQDGRR